MKRNSWLLPLLLAFAFVGCQKDLLPADAISPENAISSAADVKGWDAGFMARFRQNLIWARFPDVQTDIVNATLEYGNYYNDLHKWTLGPKNEDIEDQWRSYYIGISNVNFFFDNVGRNPLPDSVQPLIAKTKGHAYFLRAFYHYELAMRWSRTYQPDALCIPLSLVYDANLMLERSTQKQVFEQILSDLSQANALLGTVGGEPSSIEITPDVVNALRARVLLEMGRYEDAYSTASALINSSTYGFESSPAAFAKVWAEDAISRENIMQVFAKLPDERPQNYGTIYCFYSVQRAQYMPFYVPTKSFLDLYDAADYRKDAYFSTHPVLMKGSITPGITMCTKFAGAPDLNPEFGRSNRNRNKPFRIAEQYLIAAEAAYRKGDEPNAKAMLNALRTARGLAAVTSSGDALFKDIQDERSRELAFEGFRLFDLRRWGLGCNRGGEAAVQNKDILVTGNGTIDLDLPNAHRGFVYPIPAREIELNNKMLQNPGY